MLSYKVLLKKEVTSNSCTGEYFIPEKRKSISKETKKEIILLLILFKLTLVVVEFPKSYYVFSVSRYDPLISQFNFLHAFADQTVFAETWPFSPTCRYSERLPGRDGLYICSCSQVIFFKFFRKFFRENY